MQHVEFYWDPMCPFAWITSRWMAQVEKRIDLTVDWRFISLRFLNEGKDYDREFPPGYVALHTKGLRMLRVAAAVREVEGAGAMGALYAAFGESIWDRDPMPGRDAMAGIAQPAHLAAVLAAAGFDARYAAAADSEAHDATLRAETAMGLSRAGRDVGTPIVAVDPPDGPAFFGPVISRVPSDDEAIELWHAVMLLAKWPGFAELKRGLREMPQLRLLARPSV